MKQKYFYTGGQPLRTQDFIQIGEICSEGKSTLLAFQDMINVGSGVFWIGKVFYDTTGTAGNYTHEIYGGYIINSSTRIYDIFDLYNYKAAFSPPNASLLTIPRYRITGSTASNIENFTIRNATNYYVDTVTFEDLTSHDVYYDTVSFFLPTSISAGIVNIEIFDVSEFDYVSKPFDIGPDLTTKYSDVKSFPQLLYTGLTSLIQSDHYTKTETSSADSSLASAISTEISTRTLVDGTLKHKIFEIGDWDMFSTETKIVLIPMSTISTINKIRQIQVMILVDDNQPGIADLCNNWNSYTPQGSVLLSEDAEVSETDIIVTLSRKTSGVFDSHSYSSTSYNRGYITISYI